LPRIKSIVRDNVESCLGNGEAGRPDAAAAFFRIGTILSGQVNVTRAFDVKSEVPLFDVRESDGVCKVDDSLEVWCSIVTLFFLENVTIINMTSCE